MYNGQQSLADRLVLWIRQQTYKIDASSKIAPVPVLEYLPPLELYRPSWTLRYLAEFFLPGLSVYPRALVVKALGILDKRQQYRVIRGSLFDTIPDLSDAHFARMRVAGPNPFVLRRVTNEIEFNQRAPGVDKPRLDNAIGGAGLLNAITNGRIFVADYHRIGHAQSETYEINQAHARDSRWRYEGRYLPEPLVVFHDRPPASANECKLMPLTIAIDQFPRFPDPGFNPEYFYPGDSCWQIAKLFVQVADQNLHLMSSHLRNTHFMVEPFAFATRRRLAPSHPLAVLLAPHLAGTLQVNAVTYNLLTNGAESFARLYAGRLETLRRLVSNTGTRLDFSEVNLEADLTARGVSTTPLYYPYRDDARRHWAAIHSFVTAYVDLYYGASGYDLAQDVQVQAWIDEIREFVEGIGVPYSTLTNSELVELLTQLIFIAGPGHAAVHFPQELYSLPSVWPSRLRIPPPRSASATPPDLRALLPSLPTAAEQINLAYLAGYRYDRFGDYRRYRLGRLPALQPITSAFRVSLETVETDIRNLNLSRQPYRYLLPSLVPNSINL